MLQLVPVGQPPSPSPAAHDGAQKLSPANWAQTSLPHVALVMHGVQGVVGVDPPRPEPLATPPSDPKPIPSALLPAAQPADHPAAPPAARRTTSTRIQREEFFINGAMSAARRDDHEKVTSVCRCRSPPILSVRVQMRAGNARCSRRNCLRSAHFRATPSHRLAPFGRAGSSATRARAQRARQSRPSFRTRACRREGCRSGASRSPGARLACR